MASLTCRQYNGTGEILVSGQCDISMPCDCLSYYGNKTIVLHCDSCGNIEDDTDRKRTSRRIRADLRLRIIKKEKEIIKRIESMFSNGMSWDNRGSWHIDHIKPVKAFIDEGITDPYIVNHPSNLQPLWAADNLKKGCKH